MASRLSPSSTQDINEIERISEEILASAKLLMRGRTINRYNERTARADFLRLLRAAIELAPTNP